MVEDSSIFKVETCSEAGDSVSMETRRRVSSPGIPTTAPVVVEGRKVAEAVDEGRDKEGEEQGETSERFDDSRGAREEEEEKNAAEGNSVEESWLLWEGGGG